MRLFVLFFLAGCGEPANQRIVQCTDVGCYDGAFIHLAMLGVTSDQVEASTLEVCRNASCLSGSFPAWAGGASIIFPDPNQFPQVMANVRQDSPGLSLEIDFAAHRDQLVDGDRFDITWKASDGTVLAESHQTATYQMVQPNGPDCSPTCRQFSSGF